MSSKITEIEGETQINSIIADWLSSVLVGSGSMADSTKAGSVDIAVKSLVLMQVSNLPL